MPKVTDIDEHEIPKDPFNRLARAVVDPEKEKEEEEGKKKKKKSKRSRSRSRGKDERKKDREERGRPREKDGKGKAQGEYHHRAPQSRFSISGKKVKGRGRIVSVLSFLLTKSLIWYTTGYVFSVSVRAVALEVKLLRIGRQSVDELFH